VEIYLVNMISKAVRLGSVIDGISNTLKRPSFPDVHTYSAIRPGPSVNFDTTGEVNMSKSERGPLAFIVPADVTLRTKQQRRMSQQPTAIQQGGHCLGGVLDSLRNFRLS
jgi:hypothetical protein